MKKLLVLACTLGIAQPALAGTVNIGALGGVQADFRNLSEDLGSALSYKAIAPAEALGVTGFDIGLSVSQTSLAKSASLWNKIGVSNISNLYVPKLHVAKGLPLDIDIGAFVSTIPTTGISLLRRRIEVRLPAWQHRHARRGRARFSDQADRREPVVAGHQGAGRLRLQGLCHVHPVRRYRQGVDQQHAGS